MKRDRNAKRRYHKAMVRRFFLWLSRNAYSILLIFVIFLVLYYSWKTKEITAKLVEYADTQLETISVTPEPIIKKEIVVEERAVLVENMDYSHYKRVLLDVNNIPQNPELPTGCEVTSLATVINYLNPETECDKLNLADNFLDKGAVGQTDPDKAFIGNPRDGRYSFGANAPVLVNTAKKYYETLDLQRKAQNLTGTEIEDLMPYIVSGYPVMVWATIDMADSWISTQWVVDGELVQWHSNFHCLVLIGFDVERQVYYLADPLNDGITEYGMDIFKDRYDKIGKQAMIIY